MSACRIATAFQPPPIASTYTRVSISNGGWRWQRRSHVSGTERSDVALLSRPTTLLFVNPRPMDGRGAGTREHQLPRIKSPDCCARARATIVFRVPVAQQVCVHDDVDATR
jgi:hypothetical protein